MDTFVTTVQHDLNEGEDEDEDENKLFLIHTNAIGRELPTKVRRSERSWK